MNEHFVLRIPDSLPLEKAAPMLCDGTLVTVGSLAPTPPGAIDLTFVTLLRITIPGSPISSIEETQEVLDFCAEHSISAAIEVIPIDRVNEAFDRVVAKDVHFRFVIDNSTLPQTGA